MHVSLPLTVENAPVPVERGGELAVVKARREVSAAQQLVACLHAVPDSG